MTAAPHICSLRRLEARPALAVRREVGFAEAGPAVIDAFQTVADFLRRSGATPAGETYTRYLRIGLDSVHLEVGFTVRELVPAESPVRASELPAGEAVATLHRGPYERLPEAVAALEAWMRENGRTAAGPHWETYLNGPPDVTDPELFETEVVIPLAP